MAAERHTAAPQLESLIGQGFEMANALENEANLAHLQFERAQSAGSKIYWHEKGEILRATAESIQNKLSFLTHRLSELGRAPEA